MPDTQGQMKAIVFWLVVLSATASTARAEQGPGALFMGERALSDGGASCVSCHRVGDTMLGGSLGPELTHAYSKFQDRRLAALLSRGCFPRVPDISVRRPLSDDESFSLKAFLREADTNFPAVSLLQDNVRR